MEGQLPKREGEDLLFSTNEVVTSCRLVDGIISTDRSTMDFSVIDYNASKGLGFITLILYKEVS